MNMNGGYQVPATYFLINRNLQNFVLRSTSVHAPIFPHSLAGRICAVNVSISSGPLASRLPFLPILHGLPRPKA